MKLKIIITIFILLIIINYKYECIYFDQLCAEHILRKASFNNTVLFAALSRKYFYQFYNFWIVTVIPNNIPNIVIITFDEETYLFAQKKSNYVLKYNIKINQTRDIVFMDKNYITVTLSKINICKYLLELKYSVFIIDPDIVLFKNPFPFITSLERYDIIYQAETSISRVICTGFVFYRYSEKMKYFFKYLINDKEFVLGKISFEQVYITNKIYTNKFNFSLFKLPMESYLSGWTLFKNGIFFQEDLIQCILINISIICR